MTMLINGRPLEISSRAEVAVNRLPDVDRKRVLKSIEKVFAFGLRPPYAAKLRGLNNVFIIKAGLDLRIIFSVNHEAVRIVDVVRRDKLRQLAGINSEIGRAE
jgi:mRNA-degrading endonuclease RelE of RelBE toxin-antitoxin system